MNKSRAYSHPEIEFRVAATYNEVVKPNHTTLVDLLEVYPNSISFRANLDHAYLLHHFRAHGSLTKETGSQPLLRIFFIEDLNFVDATLLANEPDLEVNTTAYWMRRRFGVSPLFLSSIAQVTYGVKVGNAHLLQKEKGKRVSLDGVYRMSSGVGSRPCHLWFSHSLDNARSSTYMIHHCSKTAKSAILAYAEKKTIPMLLRPFAIDAFLAEDSLNQWGRDVYPPRNQLVTYERDNFSSYSPAQVADAVETLHSLSQLLHIIREDLTDLYERLEYLTKVFRRLVDLSGPHSDSEDLDSVPDSLDYLMAKTRTLRRWVINYNERVGIRINLFFNPSSQTDNRINLDITKLTSKIAVSTQKDSSSMITLGSSTFMSYWILTNNALLSDRMAAVTMFFLPGTFVSALFSMVFFDTQNDSITVGRQWWIFPTITVPLTITVFVAWVLWQRYRNRKDLQSLGIDRVEGLMDISEKADPSNYSREPRLDFLAPFQSETKPFS